VKEFKCGVLVPGCWATFHGESDDEILRQVVVHAREEHGMHQVPPERVHHPRAVRLPDQSVVGFAIVLPPRE
jgi:predicted small metal-binding protein